MWIAILVAVGVFLVAGFAQFFYTSFAPQERRNLALVWLAVPIGSVYLFGWLTLLPWLLGSMWGGYVRTQQNIKDQAAYNDNIIDYR